jgi:fatty acid desaturase
VNDGTRVELLAIPVVAVIFGIGALVLFAATEGPWAWIAVGIGLVLALVLIVRHLTRRYPHMWDEAPPDDPRRSTHDDDVV